MVSPTYLIEVREPLPSLWYRETAIRKTEDINSLEKVGLSNDTIDRNTGYLYIHQYQVIEKTQIGIQDLMITNTL